MSSPSISSYIALVPAAGIGQRLGGKLPKQYQPLGCYPMLVHTILALQAHPAIEHTYVVVAPDDTLFESLCSSHVKKNCTPLYVGAATRAESVLAGLKALPECFSSAWVFVHDAARPCLHLQDIQALFTALDDPDYPVTEKNRGYVLAHPVADTLKRVEKIGSYPSIVETVSRETLWQAQTPQVAQKHILTSSLEKALSSSSRNPPTDEAQALEWSGYSVQLVAAHYPNFKVTFPADQKLAEAVLSQRSADSASSSLTLLSA